MKCRIYPPPPTSSGNSFESLRETLESLHHSLSRPGQRANAPFQWSMRAFRSNGLALLKTRYSDDWSFTCEGIEDGLGLLIPRVGRVEVTLGNQAFGVSPGYSLLAPMPLLRGVRFFSDDNEHSMIALHLARKVIAEVLGEPPCETLLDKPDYDPLIDLLQGIGSTLGLTLRALVAEISENEMLEHSPHGTAGLIESLLHPILEHVSNRPGSQMIDVTPGYVRTAIGFMRANVHRPLTVREIARASEVSTRSLQTAFRRYHRTTPLRYLRRIRLEAVHAELTSPENRLPVGEVALKWGFTHLGRFSTDFKVAYGRYPSEVAKRVKRFN